MDGVNNKEKVDWMFCRCSLEQFQPKHQLPCNWLFVTAVVTPKELNRIVALLEIHVLPNHRFPNAEETPEIAQGSVVKWVFVHTAVLEVRDSVSRHELPCGGIQRHQVQVRAQEEKHSQGQDGHHPRCSQEHTVGPQPQLPGGSVTEARPVRDLTVNSELCDVLQSRLEIFVSGCFKGLVHLKKIKFWHELLS